MNRVLRSKPILIAGVVLLALAALVGWDRIRDHSELPTSWEPHGIAEDGESLTIQYVSSPCDSLARVKKRETTSTVTLKVIIQRVRKSCTDEAIYRTTEVELDRILGDRNLVDGRTGRGPEFFSHLSD